MGNEIALSRRTDPHLRVAGYADRYVLEEPAESASKQLSWREWQVVAHLEQGKSNADIAAALFISPGTVRTHLQNIYSKLGVHSRAAALARVRNLWRAAGN